MFLQSRGEGFPQSREWGVNGVSAELDEWGLYKAWVSGAGVSGFPHSRGEWDLHRAGVSGIFTEQG